MTGVVQGVGFRPFVHNLAVRVGLSGHVHNDGQGVIIEVEGDRPALDAFEQSIEREAPPLALVQSVSSTGQTPVGSTGFRIAPSDAAVTGRTLVSPDLRACDDCTREMQDPKDRRFGYPFINCTNCGPRFTIIRAFPYDRPLTTMAAFAMCERCQAEYEEVTDRRFHAQPIACPECGPRVWLERRLATEHENAIGLARSMVLGGEIVAIKGLGGFHLACDATSDLALAELRKRKGRVEKPFAVMVADLASARAIAIIDESEARLITSRQRPIVLVKAAADATLSALVAPGNGYVGVMLPYTPLHQLLIHPSETWVMTSGNRSQEPIVTDNAEARTRLADLADAFLMHDRDIEIPVDDSVVRVLDGQELPIRRSRGYAPFPISLPLALKPTLAVGAELKATFCLADGTSAFMSQHLGDMENLETMAAFERSLLHMQRLFDIEPEVLVTDLHPRYLSSRWAERHARGRPVLRVQHHHAHLASLLAEHGEMGKIIGFSFDGTGYGLDGTAWGGEVMLADLAGFERVGHLAPVRLPGGDATVERPYRMALAHLFAAGIAWDEDLPPVLACPPAERSVLAHQLETGLNSVPTTSAGRLFDAVSSLAGVRHVISYEGQAAIELEALMDDSTLGEYRFELSAEPLLTINVAPALSDLIGDIRGGATPGMVSARFHRGLVTAMLAVAIRMRERSGTNTVGCSGGVFQNATLTSEVRKRMHAEGFHALMHRLVPPNDGGIALGQAVVAGARKD